MKTSLYLDRTRNMFDSIIILPVFNITCLVIGQPIIIALEIQTGSIFCLASYHSICTFYLLKNLFLKKLPQKIFTIILQKFPEKFSIEKNFNRSEGFLIGGWMWFDISKIRTNSFYQCIHLLDVQLFPGHGQS